ncbi:hypothetical protein BCV69DRAFT_122413 [Microstroma glucosiphilum]|uniref:Uncharacterized protein n=1 Tax=Pseudomicrostroma glucosiphilum TaxID=1684307 RepID=A0A316TWD5_9BASI|nr:hypothetical protein BCV69DRAFT_122413 [Pseudomicrostroma glucosiphilum]PWN17796.1 hypothetical protein BCV69DRAFT_122413 [Pseudomicrostroma glucosiphilum]
MCRGHQWTSLVSVPRVRSPSIELAGILTACAVASCTFRKMLCPRASHCGTAIPTARRSLCYARRLDHILNHGGSIRRRCSHWLSSPWPSLRHPPLS